MSTGRVCENQSVDRITLSTQTRVTCSISVLSLDTQAGPVATPGRLQNPTLGVFPGRYPSCSIRRDSPRHPPECHSTQTTKWLHKAILDSSYPGLPDSRCPQCCLQKGHLSDLPGPHRHTDHRGSNYPGKFPGTRGIRASHLGTQFPRALAGCQGHICRYRSRLVSSTHHSHTSWTSTHQCL